MPYDFGEDAKLTNEAMVGELSKLTPLKANELSKLLLTMVDKKKSKELIYIINDTTSKQKRLTALRSHFEESG